MQSFFVIDIDLNILEDYKINNSCDSAYGGPKGIHEFSSELLVLASNWCSTAGSNVLSGTIIILDKKDISSG